MSEAIGKIITYLRQLNPAWRLRSIHAPFLIVRNGRKKETSMGMHEMTLDVLTAKQSAQDHTEERFTLAAMAKWSPDNLLKEDFTATLVANSNNATALIALYEAHWGAARAFLSIENQPRSEAVQGFLDDEYCRMVERAHAIGAKLAAMREVDPEDAESRVQTIFNCCIEMGWDLADALAVAAEAATTPQRLHQD